MDICEHGQRAKKCRKCRFDTAESGWMKTDMVDIALVNFTLGFDMARGADEHGEPWKTAQEAWKALHEDS